MPVDSWRTPRFVMVSKDPFPLPNAHDFSYDKRAKKTVTAKGW